MARASSQPAQGLYQAPNETTEVALACSQDASATFVARFVHGSRTHGSHTARLVHAWATAVRWGPGGQVLQVVTSQDLVTAYHC